MDREDTPGRWPIKDLQGRREGAPEVLMRGHHWLPYWKGGGRPVGCPRCSCGAVWHRPFRVGGWEPCRRGRERGVRAGTGPPEILRRANRGRPAAAEHSAIFQWLMPIRLGSRPSFDTFARRRPEGRWVGAGGGVASGERGSIGVRARAAGGRDRAAEWCPSPPPRLCRSDPRVLRQGLGLRRPLPRALGSTEPGERRSRAWGPRCGSGVARLPTFRSAAVPTNAAKRSEGPDSGRRPGRGISPFAEPANPAAKWTGCERPR